MNFSHVDCSGNLVLTSKHNVHTQFSAFPRVQPRCLSKIDWLYLLDICLHLSKGCTKCQGSKVYFVVSSKFYESVHRLSQPSDESDQV